MVLHIFRRLVPRASNEHAPALLEYYVASPRICNQTQMSRLALGLPRQSSRVHLCRECLPRACLAQWMHVAGGCTPQMLHPSAANRTRSALSSVVSFVPRLAPELNVAKSVSKLTCPDGDAACSKRTHWSGVSLRLVMLTPDRGRQKGTGRHGWCVGTHRSEQAIERQQAALIVVVGELPNSARKQSSQL